MTENKKKTTKKEVVETNEAPIKEVKKAKTKEKSEKQDVITEIFNIRRGQITVIS